MDRWTMQELKETDDITFAIGVLYERRKGLNPYSPLSQKISEAVATLNRIREASQRFIAEVSETQIAPDADVTDFSDCDESVKAQIVENAEKLNELEAQRCFPCEPTQPECGDCEFAGGEQLA